MSTEALAAFKTWLVDLANSYYGSEINISNFYLHPECFNAVKRYNDSINISKPNKSTGVVILNEHDYIKKIEDILDDSSKFTILELMQLTRLAHRNSV